MTCGNSAVSSSANVDDSSMAYVGLGANLGERLATLQAAVERLRDLGKVQAVSAVYETDPVGFLEQPAFLNATVGLETALAPGELVTALLGIERELGRVRTFPNAPRAIDLDLLLYGDVVMNTEVVTVPHPRLPERAFVLVPLAEIAPEVVHPGLRISIRALLDRLNPADGVRQVAGSLQR